MIAPCSCAQAASCSTGLIVPSEFETSPVATTLIAALARELVERVELELAGVVDRDVAEARARLARDELPRDEVRVVLELGDHDDVARPEVLETPRVGDEVDRLGGAAGEDHLALGRRVDERRRPCAVRPRSPRSRARRAGRRRGGRSRTRARRTSRIAVEHLPRLLRRGGRVEIRERLAVDELLEEREVRAQRGGVERARSALTAITSIVAGSGQAARSAQRHEAVVGEPEEADRDPGAERRSARAAASWAPRARRSAASPGRARTTR